MTGFEDSDEAALKDIDLSSALDYMERHNVTRMQVTIEAVDAAAQSPVPYDPRVLVMEHRELVDDSPPSPLGLAGVFVVFRSNSSY